MGKQPQDFSPHQQKIIRRYYDNQDTIQRQRLADLVGELYLAEGKKLERLWKSTGTALEKLGIPASRIAHLLEKRDPALIAGVVKELDGKPADKKK